MSDLLPTYVYVDGFNLYFGALKRTPYKWLDILKLCQRKLPQHEVRCIKYFSANVTNRPNDPNQSRRQQIYFRALKTLPNIKVILGRFQTKPRKLPQTGSTPLKFVWVDYTEEKGSDVNIASHLLMDGFNKEYEVAVIISNDSDLLEPVKMVSQKLKLKIGILNPRETQSHTLHQFATFTKRIRQGDLLASQFPETLSDSKGNFHKPNEW